MCHGADMPSENRPPSLTYRRGTDLTFGQLGEEMDRAYDREGRRPGIMAFKQKLVLYSPVSAEDGIRRVASGPAGSRELRVRERRLPIADQ